MMVSLPGSDGAEQDQDGGDDGEPSHFSYFRSFWAVGELDWALKEEIGS